MEKQVFSRPDKPKQTFYAHSDPENPGIFFILNIFGGLPYGTIRS